MPEFVACGLTMTVQVAAEAKVVVPLTQVPPSKMKLLVFDKDGPIAEDV